MALPNTHHGAETISAIMENCDAVFFIGIGGVSMCSLAQITQADGKRVVGSDRAESERLERLRDMGAMIHVGHRAENLGDCGAVVYTVAIGENNPEYQAAKERGLPLISRADYLGYLMMRYRTRVGIAGMNGKSTTTAMCAHILLGKGDPTVLCGAEAETLGGTTCRIGASRETMVFEACEYMDSFLDFNPTVAVILNVGMDHVDYFHSMQQIRDSFRTFAERTGRDGIVVVNADDPETLLSVRDFDGKIVTFGCSDHADFRAVNVTSDHGRRRFDLFYRGEFLCKLSLMQPGEYQIYNALAAATVAYLCGASPKTISERIATFVGVKRRMEYKGRLNGADVYDDYAHHPSAIEATLLSAKEMGYRRVLCAYQPHTYSRTDGLFAEFSAAFDSADRIFFTDIYAARENNESGVTSGKLAEAIGEQAVSCGDLQSLARALQKETKAGDLLIIMGAGDIEKVFAMLPLDL